MNSCSDGNPEFAELGMLKDYQRNLKKYW